MSCYTRHLREPILAAGLSFDPAGKREADRRMRAALGLKDAGCPDVWRAVKALAWQDVVLLLREPSP